MGAYLKATQPSIQFFINLLHLIISHKRTRFENPLVNTAPHRTGSLAHPEQQSRPARAALIHVDPSLPAPARTQPMGHPALLTPPTAAARATSSMHLAHAAFPRHDHADPPDRTAFQNQGKVQINIRQEGISD